MIYLYLHTKNVPVSSVCDTYVSMYNNPDPTITNRNLSNNNTGQKYQHFTVNEYRSFTQTYTHTQEIRDRIEERRERKEERGLRRGRGRGGKNMKEERGGGERKEGLGERMEGE